MIKFTLDIPAAQIISEMIEGLDAELLGAKDPYIPHTCNYQANNKFCAWGYVLNKHNLLTEEIIDKNPGITKFLTTPHLHRTRATLLQTTHDFWVRGAFTTEEYREKLRSLLHLAETTPNVLKKPI